MSPTRTTIKLTSYAQVQAYLIATFTADKTPDGSSNAEDDAANGAPHHAFWATMSYTDFVTGNVPGVPDPNDPTKGLPILIKGNSANSNIVMALLVTPGSIFDPNTGAIGQMPADGAPFLTFDQVQPLAQWIDDGCPE